jgi:hypothetical protein
MIDAGQIFLKIRSLPPEKQQEILDFLEFLQKQTGGKRLRRSLLGLCADLQVDIGEEDLTKARNEMWGNFPREVEI